MAWSFIVIRTLHPITVVLAIITLSLLGGWVSNTDIYLDGFEDFYSGAQNQDIPDIPFPADVYFSFFLGGTSLLFGGALTVPFIARRFGYSLGVVIASGCLSLLWSINAVVVIAKASNGSIMDSNYIMNKLQPFIQVLNPQQDPGNDDWSDQLEVASGIGQVVMVFAWVNSFIWSVLSVLLVHVRRRRWVNDDKTVVNQCVYNRDSKELPDRRTMQLVVDDPPSRQMKHQLVVEFRLPLTTTTHSLAPASSDIIKYARARFDFQGQESTDLSFQEGDLIRVIRKTKDANDWWEGEINGRVGEFPGNYVTLE